MFQGLSLAAFLPSFGWPEMLLIFGVVLLVFGPQKLPEVAEAMGKSIRKFRSATREMKNDITNDLESSDKDNSDT